MCFCFLGPEEPEEQFSLQLYRVTGGAALDHAYTNAIITVLKKGHPNGLFRFSGTVRPNSVITEPQSGVQQIEVPVQREFGSRGAVTVSSFMSINFSSYTDHVFIMNFVEFLVGKSLMTAFGHTFSYMIV